MHGISGETLMEGSIENLFNFIDKVGSQPELKIRTDVIALEETFAWKEKQILMPIYFGF